MVLFRRLMHTPSSLLLGLLLLAEPGVPPRTAAIVGEVEPNNEITAAQLVALDDTISGTISPAADIDFYAFDVPANTSLHLEVVAARAGSPLNSVLEFFGPNQMSIGSNDDAFGQDSRVRIDIVNPGRYYVSITDVGDRGGSSYTYRLIMGRFQPGPGDPTTSFAIGIGTAWAAAAAPNLLYIADPIRGRIVRATATGQLSLFVSNLGEPLDVVLDGFENLIVAGNDATDRAYIKRITPTGQQTDIPTNAVDPVSVTIGPDGDIWVADPQSASLLRYDQSGAPKGTVPLTGVQGLLLDIAFSPSGSLHISNFADAIYAFRNNRFERVVTANYLAGIAFDRDGYLYVASTDGIVLLFDPSYRPVNGPFAIDRLGVPANLVFGRDASGAMTNRLFSLDYFGGTIRELNRTGVRAPGFRIGVDLMTISTETLRPGFVGATYADTLRVAGVTTPLNWRIESGTLPPGLTLSTAGVISGVPEAAGTHQFTVRAEGSGRIGVKTFTLTVTRPVLEAGAAANELLGVTGSITPDLARFLDLQGNRNGRFDVGDLQLYLKSRTAQPSARRRN